MAVYSYTIVRQAGIGNLGVRFMIEDLEPFCTFETLTAARDFLMRKEHRRRRGHGGTPVADISTPDWTLDVQFKFDLPILERIHLDETGCCVRWLARFDN